MSIGLKLKKQAVLSDGPNSMLLKDIPRGQKRTRPKGNNWVWSNKKMKWMKSTRKKNKNYRHIQ